MLKSTTCTCICIRCVNHCNYFLIDLYQKKTFPDCWKLAHVLPLFKTEDPSLLCNYRPVSLLSYVSKIMERIVFKHVYNCFHCNNLFYNTRQVFCHVIPLCTCTNGVFPLSQHFEKIQVNLCWLSGNWIQVRYR